MTATRSLSASLQHLALTLAARDLIELSDAELVGRFAERRDEAAFTALVRRYGRVVLGVCRRVLRHEQDAEDAFQAAFLVLARNAASVRRAGAVGNWLYGVAYNVARKAKAMRYRREVKEREAAARQRPDVPAGLPDDLRKVLDGELHALPEKYRSPIVLCDLRGLTIREAAAEVGCPPKTLGTRLSRGRSLLARRLTRRGVAIAAGALTAALAPRASAVTVSRLIGCTVHAAVESAAGSAAAISPAVAALTEGVSNVMLPRAFKCVALLACCVLALAGLSAASRAGLSAGSTTPVIAKDAAPPREAEPAEKDEPAATRDVKPARASGHLDHLHRFFGRLFAQSMTRALLAQSIIVHVGPEAPDGKKDDEDKSAPSGTWALKGGEPKIEFCDKGVMKISAHDGALIIKCEYTAEKEGLVKAKVTEIEGKEEIKEKAKDKLPVGLKFSFKWKVKDGAATLDDLKGDNAELLKSHLEGEYEGKK